LAKWWWRLLLPDRALWKEVLVAKYGGHILIDVDGSRFKTTSSASNWWKNIMALNKAVLDKNWLMDLVARKMGN
jgi:hypothetical protein